jgi:hypothetical protein
MNSEELRQIGETLLPSSFLGVFARDEIPPLPSNCGFIVNTQDASLPGSHWIAVIVRNLKCYVYCSLALPIDHLLLSNLQKRLPQHVFDVNREQHQNYNSNNCGLFAMYFLMTNL